MNIRCALRPHVLLRALAALVAGSLLTACASPRAQSDSSAPATAQPAAGAAVEAPQTLRVVTWNIRHGEGDDGRVDLERTAQVIASLSPDIVFLQEVDRLTKRSGGVDQAAWLANRLGCWSAFGAFMPYDGGEYGLAILSRWTPTDVVNIELPAGRHEPRTSLAVTVTPAPGLAVRLYDVHLDWLTDDGDRFAQAKALLDAISGDVARQAQGPAIIAGDFNDGPGSRTVELLRSRFQEARKSGIPHTWPDADPSKEIDFIFVAPGRRLTAGPAEAVSAQRASDHRPVVGTVEVR